MGRLEHVYCTETRPYNQGARLTAYELVYEQVPSTLIADSMASLAMKEKKISGRCLVFFFFCITGVISRFHARTKVYM